MDTSFYTRQLDIIDPRKLAEKKIALIGAGGIGSWAALALGKLGCSQLHVYDFDTVADQNIACQFYKTTDLEQFKVDKLVANLDKLVETAPVAFNLKIEPDGAALKELVNYDVIILALDSITTRKMIWDSLVDVDWHGLLIDGRMAGNVIQLFTIAPDEEEFGYYEDSFFEEGEADAVACTARSVVYNCFVMAGLITDLVARFVSGETLPKVLDVDLANFTMFKD